MTTFDRASSVAHLGRLYASPDIARQRREVLDAVRLRPGQHAVDIGSGPGVLATEAAAIVTESGLVHAIDRSPRMVTAAVDLADERGVRVQGTQGDATELPLPDASVDVAMATQVLEYVDDVEAALEEIRRVLRPGGRVCIVDTDWRSCIWETHDRALADRMLDAWRDHFVHADLPRRLPRLLADAGFAIDRVDAVPIVNTTLSDGAFSAGMLPVVCRFLREHAAVDPADVDRFEHQVRELDGDGRYFFSLCRFLTSGVSP